MTWRYQCMRHKGDEDCYDRYEIHEFYEGDFGGHTGQMAWTKSGIVPSADSPEELIEILENMIKDIKKYGVRDYDTA